jgi:hypothetical protein
MSEGTAEILAVHVRYMNEKFEHIEKRLDGLATSEEVAALRAEVEKITPWTKTLETLERTAKWIAAIAAAVSATYLAIKGFGK